MAYKSLVSHDRRGQRRALCVYKRGMRSITWRARQMMTVQSLICKVENWPFCSELPVIGRVQDGANKGRARCNGCSSHLRHITCLIHITPRCRQEPIALLVSACSPWRKLGQSGVQAGGDRCHVLPSVHWRPEGLGCLQYADSWLFYIPEAMRCCALLGLSILKFTCRGETRCAHAVYATDHSPRYRHMPLKLPQRCDTFLRCAINRQVGMPVKAR